MNEKKVRKLRKETNYNPSEHKTRYRLTNKRVDERGNVTYTRECVGKRADYLKAKRE